MRRNHIIQLTMIACGLLLLTGATSCASMFMGNPNCTCTHPGPCVCCGQVVVPQGSVVAQAAHHHEDQNKVNLDSLLNQDYSLEQIYVEPEEPTRIEWKDDSITVDASTLMANVAVSGGRYMPRAVLMENTENEFFAYFTENADGTVNPLRLRVQYYADDPLNFYELMIIADGWEYHFKPASTQRGKGSGRMIWENCDEPLKMADRDMIYALSHCHWARMYLLGAGGMQHIKLLTDKQLKDFSNILNLYLLKGGKIQ